MATYVIGDIQGCFTTLKELLVQISFSPKQDHVWIAGDAVNRGANSLLTLKWARSLNGGNAMVLGNHEIHLLGAYFGIRNTKKSDTIQEILSAPDVDDLMVWLRRQKLVHTSGDRLMVHAGFSPKWELSYALDLAKRIEALIQGKQCQEFLRYYYNRKLEPQQRDWPELAAGLYTLTQIRTCKKDGELNLEFSGPVNEIPKSYHPWYELLHKSFRDRKIYFGHWAAHGYRKRDAVICVDSGCVWGGWLTAYRLEDGKVFHRKSVESKRVLSDWPELPFQ